MIELIFCTRFQVENNHAFYPKKYITEQLKDAPGGTHIVLTGTGIKGTPLMAIGYRYSSKATLFFICTQDAGSTRAGVPYEMKFTDSYKNVCVRYIDRPQVIADYFQDSNIIDTLNHVRQFELALEKNGARTTFTFASARQWRASAHVKFGSFQDFIVYLKDLTSHNKMEMMYSLPKGTSL